MIEAGTIDILFGNEDEIRHLIGSTDLDACIAALEGAVKTLVITRGADGALAVEDGRRAEIVAARVAKIVDTTGAGDLFAAGFLAARCRGRDLEGCLQIGTSCAAEIISHFGARPEADLKTLVRL
jgi:sugar/nucleoside kinase (ribokinase family)